MFILFHTEGKPVVINTEFIECVVPSKEGKTQLKPTDWAVNGFYMVDESFDYVCSILTRKD